MVVLREIKYFIYFIFTLIRQSIRTHIITYDRTKTNESYKVPKIVKGDSKSTSNYIVTSIVTSYGDIIIARSGGKVFRLSTSGKETEILNIPGAEDWRGLWEDSKGNVFISPHCTPALGSIKIEDRGIYKLSPTDSFFRKVYNFYNPQSEIQTEREKNNDTIWTFCEDEDGAIYAGMYAHTIRNNPSIYKSLDNGETWDCIYNFNTSGLLTKGRHIHGIVYSRVDKSLYCIVGEINDLFKSRDGGHTWISLGVKCELAKGSALYAVKDGIIIGSDSAYDLVMSKYYFKNRKVKTTSRLAGATIFAIRQSDLTHRIYAFSKIDGSVKLPSYFPPFSAKYNKIELLKWLLHSGIARYNWLLYYLRMYKRFPEDAFFPQHNYILMSDNDGETWQVIFKDKTTYKGPNGFWVTGYFCNGECLTSYMDASLKFVNPFILYEQETIKTLSRLL